MGVSLHMIYPELCCLAYRHFLDCAFCSRNASAAPNTACIIWSCFSPDQLTEFQLRTNHFVAVVLAVNARSKSVLEPEGSSSKRAKMSVEGIGMKTTSKSRQPLISQYNTLDRIQSYYSTTNVVQFSFSRQRGGVGSQKRARPR